MTTTAATAAAPQDAGLWFMNAYIDVKVSGADNADRLCVMEQTLPFDEAPPFHVHHEEDEVFHILDGVVRFQVGTQVRTAHAGETLLAPRGVPHGFRVVSPQGARFLTVTRGGFETMVRKASRPAKTTGLPKAEAPTAQMQAALALLCNAERITLLGPPIA